jgi:hypothetical protein
VMGLALITSLSATLLAGIPAGAKPDRVTKDDIAAGKERAQERAAAVDRVESQLGELQDQLAQVQQEAQLAIARYHREQEELRRAKAQYQKARDRWLEAKRERERARRDVGQLAADSYRTSGGLLDVSALVQSNGPAALFDRIAAIAIFSLHDSATLARMRRAEAEAAASKESASKAYHKQQRATKRVAQAKDEAEAAVERQKQRVVALRDRQAELQAQLSRAQSAVLALKRQRQAYLDWKASGGDAAFGCDPDETAVAKEYPNGEIPESALCSLPQPGHMLRPDAAIAFIKLNRAYEKDHGEWICVTDSYRSLETQRILYEEKGPDLAAKPGTSRHGLGIAVDLCGGIESFGTDTYEWMKANAPRFGWYHPAWAEPNGSMPEPWHWEYDAN